ncbi:MAG: phosphoribosylformylglycinamidine cyclo-ligase [Bowdeniella nasicola]|nr:phosphoribosylformylglycinamidine cyclo-ligase [Bowdeniella nasicola]
MTRPSLTYAAAGVDTQAGDRAVDLMKAAVGATHGPHVYGDFGGFAGLFDASALREYTRPLLATSTDGVGTKVDLARRLDVHDTIGQDLVAMVVDDIVVMGARPLFMTDYIACGEVVPERISAIVTGIANACAACDTALLGGETAEHPGLLAPEEYDIAGAVTGVVEEGEMLGAHRVRPGDVLLALASSGLHSNGYSLVRAALAAADVDLEAHDDEFGRTVGEELLEPTRLYTPICLPLLAQGGVHAMAHVTGGGLAANLARVLPKGLRGRVIRSSWQVPPVFTAVQAWGQVPIEDLENTLNLGVGMVLVCDPQKVDDIRVAVQTTDCDAWVLGEVAEDGEQVSGTYVSGTKGVDGGSVELIGQYRN